MPASPSEPTPAAQFSEGQTTRAADRFSDVMPATYDEKDDMGLLRQKLEGRKKPIYAGLAFLCVVVIGVSIAVSSGKSTEASVKSGYDAPSVTTPAPAPAPPAADASDTGGVHAADLTTEAKSTSGSGAHGSVAGDAKNEEGFMEPATNATATPVPSSTTTPAPTTPEPTTGPLLPFKALDFDWKDSSKWEYANGSPVPSGMIAQDGIKLTPANSQQPIRTKEGWGGDKIVYIEWERSDSSDTNIWMLNTKLQNQFAVGNGWPYWGELDIFEMFTQDAVNGYDFTGQAELSDVKSYGQLTLHNGPRKEDGQPCFCPWAGSKSSWYQNTKPMTSGCTAQFANTPKNSMATVWGRDGTGQYLQLLQNPTIVLGGKDKQGAQTYDVKPGGVSTMKIYNNKDLFWGTPASSPCAKGGGHNPATGFPFFEDFRLILEEQKKNDASAWFKVTNIQIFKA